QKSIFRARTLEVGDVVQIKWRTLPVGGSIIVRTHSEKVKIYLDNFTKDDREEVVFFFRQTFANEVQENWSLFEEHARSLSATERRVPRGGMMVIACIFMCLAGLFVYCWFAGLGVRYLFLGFVNAIAAICYVWFPCRQRSYLMKESKS